MTELDTYIINCATNYPTLYSGESYQDVKMRVLDQFLNTIGNGVSDDNELAIEIESHRNPVSFDDIEPVINGEKIFYGYKKVVEVFEDYFQGEGEFEHIYERDVKNRPDIVHLVECRHREHSLYPNFQARYSTIYQCPTFLKLDSSFLEGAIEFYEYAKMKIESGSGKYHSEFPKATEQETKNTIEDYESALTRYDSNEEVSKAYGVEYTGDLYQFISDRWKREKAQILQFINNTLILLKSSLQ